MSEKKIILIQRTFREFLINKQIKKINFLNLDQSIHIEEFMKLIKKKEIITIFKNFINLIKNRYGNFDITPNILISSFLFNIYTEDIMGTESLHNIDINLISWSKKINELFREENLNLKKFHIFISNYNELFKNWKELDKNRTIERIIVSYYNRIEHIKLIKEQNIDTSQESILELENQCVTLLSSVKFIDPDFDVKYFLENYELVYDNLVKGYDNILQSINKNFEKAYLDFLINEFSNGNIKIILDNIKEINKKIELLYDKNKDYFIENSILKINYTELLLENKWSPELSNYFIFIFTNIINLSAPIDDKDNLICFEELKIQVINEDFPTSLCKCIILINQKIDLINMRLKNLKSK